MSKSILRVTFSVPAEAEVMYSDRSSWNMVTEHIRVKVAVRLEYDGYSCNPVLETVEEDLEEK